jgi:hypothetical protein
MSDHRIADSSSTEGLPIAPSMGPALESMPLRTTGVTSRVVFITAIAVDRTGGGLGRPNPTSLIRQSNPFTGADSCEVIPVLSRGAGSTQPARAAGIL